MTTRLERLTRPAQTATPDVRTRHRRIGFTLALIGLTLALVGFVANLVAAGRLDNGEEVGDTLAWSFGLSTAAFGTIKLGIGVVLIGILIQLWQRVESVKRSLPDLRAAAAPKIEVGSLSTPYGSATAGKDVPGPLAIHKMAKRMWAPMLAMGYMAVLAGLVVSFAWAGDPADVALASWTQGLQFLGEGLLLAGVSFLLGTILASLREGGGEVQASLGLTVKTLKMPKTAKVFVGLMALGVMVSMLQFVLYLVVANGVDDPATWFAWLGPLREVGLGVILSAVVMALVTIGNVLRFQFDRIKEIVTTGN